MQLTDEQAELVRCVGNGRNVHSNSCPGGGKTTTLKRAIDALPLDETAGGPTVLVLTSVPEFLLGSRRRVRTSGSFRS